MRDPYLEQVARCMRVVVRREVAAQGLTVPVPIDTLLRQKGWRIVEIPMPGRTEGVTLFDSRDVFVNQRLSAFAKRFALAHEAIHAQYHAGHAPRGTDYLNLTYPYHDEMEAEANAGAAELLLPYEWFMDTARTVLGRPLPTAADLRAFLASPEARKWAGQARVTPAVLGYHLQDLGWAGASR